jgi:hypothetical protein
MSAMGKKVVPRLHVKDFGPIALADVEFGDLTVLVGPQATGKSLALQLLKLCIDGQRVARELSDNGFQWDDAPTLLGHVFGEGMGQAWRRETRVSLSGRDLDIQWLAERAKKLSSPQEVFYIPAQRALTVIDGWPVVFTGGPLGTPYVVRRFSQGLLDLLRSYGAESPLFPVDRRLRVGLRQAIDSAVFHGAPLKRHTVRNRSELRLSFGGETLPTIAWTAGQREFAPLLVALYSLMPAGKFTKVHSVDWVVLEEPEMGLHPRAILAVMLLVLELLARGYRVLLSTHHPLVLDVVWGLTRIQQHPKRGNPKRVLNLFGDLGAPDLRSVGEAALEKTYRVTSFDFDGKRVVTRDISGLNSGAADAREAGWGGLSGLSGQIGDVVAEVVSS